MRLVLARLSGAAAEGAEVTERRAAYRLPGQRSKYGVRTDEAGKAARTVDGILFASAGEAHRYQELRLLEQAGEIRDLERQERFEIRVNGRHIASYVADFCYWRGDERIVEDVKGVRTETYRLKARLMLALHGVRILETEPPRGSWGRV